MMGRPLLLTLLVLAQPALAAPVPTVLHPTEVRSVAFFPEELRRLDERAAVFLREQKAVKIALEPPARMQALVQLVASRKSQPEGPVCRAAPTLELLVRTQWPTHARAFVSAEYGCPGRPTPGGPGALPPPSGEPCTPRVQLVVRLMQPPEWRTLARWEAPVEDTTSVDVWLAAFKALVRTGPSTDEVGVMGLASPERPALEVTQVGGDGPWGDMAPDAALLQEDATRAGCVYPEKELGTQLVLAVNQEGRVTRCHAYSGDGWPAEAHRRCLCDALSKRTFPAASAKRRLAVDFLNHIESMAETRRALTTGAVSLRKDDGSTARFFDEGLGGMTSAVRACVRTLEVKKQVVLPFELAVLPDGGVAPVTLPAVETVPPEARQCIERAIAQGRFPCPLESTPKRIEAEVRVGPPIRGLGF